MNEFSLIVRATALGAMLLSTSLHAAPAAFQYKLWAPGVRAAIVKPSLPPEPLLPIYSFTSHTFTSCGATGAFGPTLSACQSKYGSAASWALDPATFTVNNGIQLWTVPETGMYQFQVIGAKGGHAETYAGGVAEGSEGKVLIVKLELTQGDVIRLLVGQPGVGSGRGSAGGGGGASFVVRETTPLIVAAGGKGAPNSYPVSFNRYGAGFAEDGEVNEASYAAQSFLNGGVGGRPLTPSPCMYQEKAGAGGFGGGGASSCRDGGMGGAYQGAQLAHPTGYSVVEPIQERYAKYRESASITITRL